VSLWLINIYLLKLTMCSSLSMLNPTFLKDSGDRSLMPSSENLFSMMLLGIIGWAFEIIILFVELFSLRKYILLVLTFMYECFSIKFSTMFLFAKYTKNQLSEILDASMTFEGGVNLLIATINLFYTVYSIKHNGLGLL